MIKYALRCPQEHAFEGWFDNSEAFDSQVAAGNLACPLCGAKEIAKAPMAPAVVTSKAGAKSKRAEIAEQMRAHIRDNFDYVGDRFADEARAIGAGDSEDRPIWGEVTPEEARELAEEGLPVAPLPAEIAPTPKAKLN